MSIKNPYKFIEKANGTFNSYLEEYPEIKNYMISSSKEHKEFKELFISFIEEYHNNQENLININFKVLNFFENLIESVNNTNSLIKELETKINDLVNENKSDKKNMETLIDNLSSEFNNSLNLSFVDLTNLLGVIENTVVSGFDEVGRNRVEDNDLVSGRFVDLSKDLGVIKDSVVSGFDEVGRNRVEDKELFGNKLDDINIFIKNNNEEFKRSSEIIENHYNNCRKYFFNGREDELKKITNTDLLFNFCYFNDIKLISYSPEENNLLLKTSEGIILSTNNHIFTIMELYGLNEYMVPILYNLEEFVVFDIGMNRAYATLKFANFNNCSKVYGFEIDDLTYSMALENISLNPHLSRKIQTFNFGLSDKDDIVDLYSYVGYDGLNTMIYEFLESNSALNEYIDQVDVKKVKVKKASKVISEILTENKIESNIVLKIDTEGAEYKIIGDLISSGLIEEIDVIIGEGHIFSEDDFKEDLLNLGFKIVQFKMSKATYNFAFVKEKHFNMWPLFIA